ncbi:hypothetical protein [Nonomuraea sp. NPDC049028]|uniref:hypothetical protein n=1 Tax=Nonomuraea sp. NPDC049028 TaxID=3364348 RepID=UPI003724094A
MSPLRKLFDFAAQYQIKSAIHGPEDISPVGMAAAIHLGLSIHNASAHPYEPSYLPLNRLQDGTIHDW